MKAQLEQIRRAAKEALASFDSAEQLEKARIQYLGKKGELTAILKQMGKLSANWQTKFARTLRTPSPTSPQRSRRQLRRSGWLRKPWM